MNQINPNALDALLEAARDASSSAVVVWQEGSPPLEWWFRGHPRRIETMSVTKSVVNLIVGRAVTLGLIESADTPVHEFYPEWRQGRKQLITLRHLMSHTSGLQDLRTTNIEIYPSPDFVKLALAAELEDEPGACFRYSNKAVNLLAGVIARATGKPMQRFAATELFDPMEIEFDWMRDEAGNPHGMAGLKVYPKDLAKLGRLALQRGLWNDTQLISEDWLEQSLRPGCDLNPNHGWLWWLKNKFDSVTVNDSHVTALEGAGASPTELNMYREMIGVYPSLSAFGNALDERKGESILRFSGRTKLYDATIQKLEAFYANGYLGQYLVVIPEHRLVAVRMLEWYRGAEQGGSDFDEFQSLVRALVQNP